MSTFKVALIQMLVGSDKQANVLKAEKMIEEAAKQGAKLVVLPECFNSPYGNQYFNQYAEPIPGPTTQSLSDAAKKWNISLIGGSFPEKCPASGKLYNTCAIFNKAGALAGVYRKMHMFDLDVPGKITFKESDTLTPGNQPVIFKTDLCSIGLSICHDSRFNELSELYVQRGCEMLVCPSAFELVTGAAHWELMARSIAMQTQCFFAYCSPARDAKATYVDWGHSLVVDPWGTVIASSDDRETIVYADIDINKVKQFREMMPLRNQRRTDIYDTVCRIEPIIIK